MIFINSKNQISEKDEDIIRDFILDNFDLTKKFKLHTLFLQILEIAKNDSKKTDIACLSFNEKELKFTRKRELIFIKI